MSSNPNPNKKDQKPKTRFSQIISKSNSGVAAAGPSNVTNKPSTYAFSVLEKLVMNKLEKSAIKYVKSSSKTNKKDQQETNAETRKACIDYALEMVISNLIVSGQLDPTKAYQMRTPIMKTQIASMCDKILERRAKKEAVKQAEAKSLSKPVSSVATTGAARSKGAIVQKWAVQPASLPITTITNQDLSKMATPVGEKEKKAENVGKKRDPLQSKSQDGSASSIEREKSSKGSKSPKKRRSRSKSKTSSVSSTEAAAVQVEPKPLPPLKSRVGTLESEVMKNIDFDRVKQETPKPQRLYPAQASSEVPSNFSIDSGARLLSNSSVVDRAGGRTVQFEIKNKKVLSGVIPNAAALEEGKAANELAESCPGTAKTLNSIISSTTSFSANLKEFQMVVDMKGFQNDEIAMEVEGRKLIFLASRPKRADMNLRKVTEVVELPPGVKMENLKIGRRPDGFVVIEEHDVEQQ